jgi:hypothetical protein
MEWGISDDFEFRIKFDRTTPIKLVCSKNVSYPPLCTLGHLKTAIEPTFRTPLGQPTRIESLNVDIPRQ